MFAFITNVDVYHMCIVARLAVPMVMVTVELIRKWWNQTENGEEH